MKVLWFSPVPLPAVLSHAGVNGAGAGGHWVAALAERVAERNDVQLAIATAAQGLEDATFTNGNVRYFVIGQPKRTRPFVMSSRDIAKAAACFEDFRPDIVHVHGTERFFGLLKARGFVKSPEVVSLQGILRPYSTWTNYFGALTPLQILASTRIAELLLGLGLLWNYRDMRKGAERETEILRHADAVLGRTSWDRAQAFSQNPQARYFHVGEILREEFARSKWDISHVTRHSIIYTNAGHPRRGTEVLLSAMRILKEEFPDVSLRLAGQISQRSGYGRFLRRQIRAAGLERNVSLLGYLDAARMADELTRAHVFTIASYIENSPNSLAEAMTVGMPCVASYVGGIPDMVETGKTGILFPAGDAEMLADSIRRVFRDDDLAKRIGAEARRVALTRHDPETVVTQLLDAYRQIIGSTQS
jgi:glycosyltransferase involved in cell wall biosynthesis